jgi:predicted amidophosphoribosyltransferase
MNCEERCKAKGTRENCTHYVPKKIQEIDVDLAFTNVMTKWAFVAHDRIICPHCESEFKDLGRPDGVTEMRCPECEQPFTVSISTSKTYRTSCGRLPEGKAMIKL